MGSSYNRFDCEVESIVGCDTAAVGEMVTFSVAGSKKMPESSLHCLHWGVSIDGVIKPAPTRSYGWLETVEIVMCEEWVGKEIIIMAHNGGRSTDFKESTGLKVEVTANPRVMPREISGFDEANVGDTVEYKVTRYNRAADKISERQKQGMRWAIKVNGVQEVLTDEVGEIFNLDIRKEWDGKEIVVMAAMFSWEFDEGVSQRTRVGDCVMEITDAYWIDEDGEKQCDLDTDFPVTLFIKLKDFILGSNIDFHFENQDNDGENANYSGVVGEDGIVKIDEFQLKLNDNLNGNI
jgi:hypothetical protein